MARVTGVITNLYTVPSGRRTIVRCVEAVNMSATAALCAFGAEGGVAGDVLWGPIATLSTFQSLTSDSWRVLEEGDILQFTNGAATGRDVSVSAFGAELLL